MPRSEIHDSQHTRNVDGWALCSIESRGGNVRLSDGVMTIGLNTQGLPTFGALTDLEPQGRL